MRRFLTLLSARKKLSTHFQKNTNNNNNNTIHNNNQETNNNQNQHNLIQSGPTVPQSLSRRILNRQGVNYMDESVSAIMSGAADRFLATVLQQSMICRDRRLDGEEMAKKEQKALHKFKKRRREMKRLKEKKKQKVIKDLEVAIHSKTGAMNGVMGGGGNKKMSAAAMNKRINSAITTKLINDVEKVLEDDKIQDPVDEEMNYYDDQLKSRGDDSSKNGDENGNKNNNGDGNNSNNQNRDENGHDQNIEDDYSDDDEEEESDEDDDETKFALQLRDVVRPLEAWGVLLTGKLGLSTPPNNPEMTKNQSEMAADDDSNADADGDPDVEGDEGDDDDDDISISAASINTASKTKGGKKRAVTPKGSNLKSPSKGKVRSPTTPHVETNASDSVSGRAATPSSGGTKTSKM